MEFKGIVTSLKFELYFKSYVLSGNARMKLWKLKHAFIHYLLHVINFILLCTS